MKLRNNSLMETFKSIALRQQDASAENTTEAAPAKTYEDMFNHYKARKEIMAKVRLTTNSVAYQPTVTFRRSKWT